MLYEGLIYVAQPGDYKVRISVDAWMKNLLSWTGFDVITATFALVFAIGIVVLIVERKRLKDLNWGTFLWMHAESIVYAIAMAASVSYVVSQLFSMQAVSGEPHTLSIIDQFALSLGAGLYEELFFRVILVGLLFMVFKRTFRQLWVAAAVAAVIGALIFSAVHYVGNMGDAFTWSSFAFRALAGLVLNGLYVWRGFGIAVCTHAWYDLFVLLL